MMKPITCNEVIEKERQHLLRRREQLCIENGTKDHPNWFGIALSGGGIRSATINMGFLKTLNKYGVLEKADYLSSVSGGGYINSYVQATLKETGDYSKLFSTDHIDAMRQHGEYMVPHTGLFGKTGNMLLLIIAFIVSWLMSLVSPTIVAGIVYCLYMLGAGLLGVEPFRFLDFLGGHPWTYWVAVFSGALLGIHFLANIILNFNLNISKAFNRAEAVIVALALGLYAWMLIVGYKGVEKQAFAQQETYAIIAVTLFCIGFFTNPNALSFHRFYRKQLSDLFLRFSGVYKNIPLGKVFNAESKDERDYLNPYPLINTCLNLMNPEKDEAFQGTKTSDYFLLSPFYCGSKLVGYVPTDRYTDYQRMTLPAAVTISAAAVNPGMGIYSNRVLSLLMTIFNFRLGFWISNPLILMRAKAIVWWPLYFFYELLGRIGSQKKMINISDGGHIENLGVYELLRRGCRLIIAVDAGEDGTYSFVDLNNLILRARNEMGLEIKFRKDEQPEELIRPRPSQVYSAKRFAIADIYKCWEEVPDPGQKDGKRIVNYSEAERLAAGPVGTFVYVKSSVRAPESKPDLDKRDELKYGTYKYKIYHPEFPHEPTSDQFFDKIQWEAYFQLGRFMAADVLGVKKLDEAGEKPAFADLLNWFDHYVNFFEAPAEAQTDRGGLESYKMPEAAGAVPELKDEKPDAGYQM